MNPGRHFTVKAVKPGIQEGIAHLAGAVRTEVEEKHHVIIAHALFVAVGKNAGLQEFIRLALGVALFHIFGGEQVHCSPRPSTMASHASLLRSQRLSRSIA